MYSKTVNIPAVTISDVIEIQDQMHVMFFLPMIPKILTNSILQCKNNTLEARRSTIFYLVWNKKCSVCCEGNVVQVVRGALLPLFVPQYKYVEGDKLTVSTNCSLGKVNSHIFIENCWQHIRSSDSATFFVTTFERRPLLTLKQTSLAEGKEN